MLTSFRCAISRSGDFNDFLVDLVEKYGYQLHQPFSATRSAQDRDLMALASILQDLHCDWVAPGSRTKIRASWLWPRCQKFSVLIVYRHDVSIPLLPGCQDGSALIRKLRLTARKQEEVYTFLTGEVASTVKVTAALSKREQIRLGKEEMSKHDAVPVPVEEYEYARPIWGHLRLSALTFEQL